MRAIARSSRAARTRRRQRPGLRERLRLLFAEASLHVSAVLSELLDMLRIGH
ncbi:MAG TPA: hypothetical protein VKU89_03945 [Solirubrobacteraceae bacterium]|nr:hypothetical protein [Solirubrobacteraceae bacterium]